MKNIFLALTMVVISILPAKSQDSTDNPITKRFGLACFPIDNKGGFTYCFGKKGRIKIEYDFTLSFSEANSYSLILHELKFMYAWKCSGFKKVYSGVGVEDGALYYNQNGTYHSVQPNGVNSIYGIITPIGIELFPTSRLPGFSIILESKLKITHLNGNGVGVYGFGRVGLCCYFPERKHNSKKRNINGKVTYL